MSPFLPPKLKEFLLSRLDSLCDDCRRRYENNPLRTLDCKSHGCKEATADAPSVLDNLCAGCADHFARTQEYLRETGTPYEINPRMVRGLDYYTRTTFELVTGLLGAQSAVAAGGRYDSLIEQLGGPALPGIGFAMGVRGSFFCLISRSSQQDLTCLWHISENRPERSQADVRIAATRSFRRSRL
jgi:histidyl-tRNA synthetase